MKPSLSATQQALYNVDEPYEEIDESGLFYDQPVQTTSKPVQNPQAYNTPTVNSLQLKGGFTETPKDQGVPGGAEKGLNNETHKAFLQLKKLVKKELSLDLWITSGYRSFKEQEKLYNNHLQGISHLPAVAPGHSWHNFGLAFDVNAKDIRGNIINSSNTEIFQKIGEAGRRIGLKWGGDFKKKDPVHFHLAGYDMKELRRKHGIK